jgi:hypothetical protein
MVTDFGRNWIAARLAACHTVSDLDRAWGDVAEAYQADRRLAGYYMLRRKQMEKEANG